MNTDPEAFRSALPFLKYECECCGFRLCERKLKGIGYYCPDCFDNCYAEFTEQGSPSAHAPRRWRETITHWRLAQQQAQR